MSSSPGGRSPRRVLPFTLRCVPLAEAARLLLLPLLRRMAEATEEEAEAKTGEGWLKKEPCRVRGIEAEAEVEAEEADREGGGPLVLRGVDVRCCCGCGGGGGVGEGFTTTAAATGEAAGGDGRAPGLSGCCCPCRCACAAAAAGVGVLPLPTTFPSSSRIRRCSSRSSVFCRVMPRRWKGTPVFGFGVSIEGRINPAP